jgi:hypothetical protein
LFIGEDDLEEHDVNQNFEIDKRENTEEYVFNDINEDLEFFEFESIEKAGAVNDINIDFEINHFANIEKETAKKVKLHQEMK